MDLTACTPEVSFQSKTDRIGCLIMNDLRLNDYYLRVDSTSGIERNPRSKSNGSSLPESDDAWIEELWSNLKAIRIRDVASLG